MKNRLLSPERVCLQVIDVQESLMAKIHKNTQVVATTKMMVGAARVLGLEIIANTQYSKGLGPYVKELEGLFADIPFYDKVEFNGFANRETRARIDRLPATVDTVALVGVETHICIYQTAVALLDYGFKVWIVSDGVSSRNVSDHEMALQRLQQLGAAVGPAEMLIYELLGRAGTPAFKEVLPLVLARDAGKQL